MSGWPLWIVYVLLYGLLVALLVGPAVAFRIWGWPRKRWEILGNFTPEAGRYYLRCFRSLKTPLTNDEVVERLEEIYEEQLTRKAFVWPLVLLAGIGGGGLWLCMVAVALWIHGGQFDTVLPAQAVLAILGAYLWVVYDQITRSGRDHLRAEDLYRGSFRFAIAVPMAYAFGAIFAENAALPLAFVLGALPTGTITTMARRAAARLMPLTDAPPSMQSRLQVLPSVDTFAAERFADEGVSTPQQLACADPVRLTVRTGLGFSDVLGCAGEALMWSYLEERMHAARKYGILGAYECRSLLEDRHSPDQAVQARAHRLLQAIASEMSLAKEDLTYILEQVAYDPYTEFQWHCWAGQMSHTPAGAAPAPPRHTEEEAAAGRR